MTSHVFRGQHGARSNSHGVAPPSRCSALLLRSKAGLGLPPFDVFLSSPFRLSHFPAAAITSVGLNQAPVAQLVELHGYDCGAVEDREVQ